MYLAGFSINVLSMLAIVLSVGLVVDDAIVMTENIYIRIEKGMSPKEAGIEGAKEIFFAVYFNDDHTGCRILPDCLHGRYDGTVIPRVQYRNFGFGYHFFVRGTDFHSDVGNQTTDQTGKAKLVLCKDRTVL